jgi:hypothetical protein
MTWFKLSDQFYDHPKVMKAGNAAVGLWVRACTYSAQKEEDGRVPMDMAHLYGTRRDIDRLTASGLWIVQDDHYWVPDFLQFNPSHAELEARRKRETEKKRRQRDSVDRSTAGQFMSRNVSPGDAWGDDPGDSP